jgi:uncharacterized protein with FMN-binding domain
MQRCAGPWGPGMKGILGKQHLMSASMVRLAVGAAVLGCLLGAGPALADVVQLKNGKKFEGLAEEKPDSVVLRLERGSITFARDDVERIDKCPPPWEVYEQKAKGLKPEDAAGHLELAKWCKANNLGQRMQKELQLVLLVDPEHQEARALLGYQKIEGKWLSPEEYQAYLLGKKPGPAPAPAPAPGPAPAPAPGPAPVPRIIPDGNHRGASRGYVEDVAVQVTVAGGKITEVRITGNRENRALTSLTDVPPKIVQKQQTQVDATSRATITSRAIMRAAQSALDGSVPVPVSAVPDGRYTGTSKSYWTDLTVEVEVRGGKIASVKVTSSREPPRNAQAQQALTDIPKLIVDQQSTAVPPLAGAEATSQAIMRAAQSALDSAVPRVLSGK